MLGVQKREREMLRERGRERSACVIAFRSLSRINLAEKFIQLQWQQKKSSQNGKASNRCVWPCRRAAAATEGRRADSAAEKQTD